MLRLPPAQQPPHHRAHNGGHGQPGEQCLDERAFGHPAWFLTMSGMYATNPP